MNVAILTADDKVWALDAWNRTIPLVAAKHRVVGIRVVPARLSHLKGGEIADWYRRTFGLVDFARLGCYAVLKTFFSPGPRSWESLARRHGVPLAFSPSVNDSSVDRWIRDVQADVVLVWVDEILKEPVLLAPRMGFLNKHAGLLPECRGLFPYFWSVAGGLPAGVSYHLIDGGIDTGPVLHRINRGVSKAPPSMLAFYQEVYRSFPSDVAVALEALEAGRKGNRPEKRGRYFGLPERKDVRVFRARGGRVARWGDVFRLS